MLNLRMSPAENKLLMQRLFTEWAKGDPRPFLGAMADDVRWTITGNTAWSGTYDGKVAVLGELLTPLSEQLRGRSIILAQRFIAEDDLVVVEAQGRNSTKDGMRYHNAYCFVCRLRDGQLVELTEYADTQLVATALRAPR